MLYDLILMRENPEMLNDPFSDLLRLMNARSVASGSLVAGGTWALAIPPPDGVKFWGVARGGCWLKVEGVRKPIRLESGEIFLMAAPRSLLMCSDLQGPRTQLHDLLSRREGTTAYLGEGDDFHLIGGNVELGHTGADLLLEALPPFIHIDAQSPHALKLHWLLDQLVCERADDLPGASTASAQLAHLMFIQILRAHFDSAPSLAPGWLRAANDRRLAPALRLVHTDPGRNWQLGELASAAAMSRAAFAAYFKNIAGIAPVAYLTAWRMRLAQHALREESLSISTLANRFGYASDSAFSNAFKRVTGHSPKFYRDRP